MALPDGIYHMQPTVKPPMPGLVEMGLARRCPFCDYDNVKLLKTGNTLKYQCKQCNQFFGI